MNPDAEKVLLADIKNNNSKEALKYQFMNAPLYLDKWYAMKNYASDTAHLVDSNMFEMADYALVHPFHGIRGLGLELLDDFEENQVALYEPELIKIVRSDSTSANRAKALSLLKKFSPGKYEDVFEEKLNDSSFLVVSNALIALSDANEKKGLEYAAKFEKSKNGSMISAVASIYSRSGDSSYRIFFIETIKQEGSYKYDILRSYWSFIERQPYEGQLFCLDELNKLMIERKPDKYSAFLNSQMASRMKKKTVDQIKQNEMALKKEKNPAKRSELQRQNETMGKVNKKLELFISR